MAAAVAGALSHPLQLASHRLIGLVGRDRTMPRHPIRLPAQVIRGCQRLMDQPALP